MDEFTEKKFGYYKEKSIEELEQERKEIMYEINYILETIEDKKTTSSKKSELLNTDLKYEREKLNYIDLLIQEKNNSKKR